MAVELTGAGLPGLTRNLVTRNLVARQTRANKNHGYGIIAWSMVMDSGT